MMLLEIIGYLAFLSLITSSLISSSEMRLEIKLLTLISILLIPTVFMIAWVNITVSDADQQADQRMGYFLPPVLTLLASIAGTTGGAAWGLFVMYITHSLRAEKAFFSERLLQVIAIVLATLPSLAWATIFLAGD
jgi:hypothetical protein